jgi:hypothetical protein
LSARAMRPQMFRLNWSSLAAAVLVTGCAESLFLQNRGVGGGASKVSFWPPPPATSISISEGMHSALSANLAFGEYAHRIEAGLQDAGYMSARWYTIGTRYAHGFSVTTRLEAIDIDGRSKPEPDRWLSRFPDAANLLWLRDAKHLLLPGDARFRVFLVAFTDLPIEPRTARAPVWNEQTWMGEGNERLPSDFPFARDALPNYRFGIYVYEYVSHATDGEGQLVASDDASLPAVAHIEASGILSVWR